jgi:hypothetical protein
MLRLLVISALVALAAAQTRPQPSESFTAFSQMEIKFNDSSNEEHYLVGQGQFGVDSKSQRSLEQYHFDGRDMHVFDVFNLQRFDLGYFYSVNETAHTCNATKLVNDTFPKLWDWLHIANYSGEIAHYNEILQLWEADLGYAKLGLGVRKSDPNTPVWMRRRSQQREVNVYFHKFFPVPPPEQFFTVPKICVNPNMVAPAPKLNNLKCVSRGDMQARGQSWVNARVPYNQGATYGGYREDCSGFVSMTWETSKPGYVTSTIPQIAHRINKGDLAVGDVLLYAAEHVVFFNGWADSSQSQYHAMEETRPGEGTVARVTPYPYWYSQSDFVPYRFNSVC